MPKQDLLLVGLGGGVVGGPGGVHGSGVPVGAGLSGAAVAPGRNLSSRPIPCSVTDADGHLAASVGADGDQGADLLPRGPHQAARRVPVRGVHLDHLWEGEVGGALPPVQALVTSATGTNWGAATAAPTMNTWAAVEELVMMEWRWKL